MGLCLTGKVTGISDCRKLRIGQQAHGVFKGAGRGTVSCRPWSAALLGCVPSSCLLGEGLGDSVLPGPALLDTNPYGLSGHLHFTSEETDSERSGFELKVT